MEGSVAGKKCSCSYAQVYEFKNIAVNFSYNNNYCIIMKTTVTLNINVCTNGEKHDETTRISLHHSAITQIQSTDNSETMFASGIQLQFNQQRQQYQLSARNHQHFCSIMSHFFPFFFFLAVHFCSSLFCCTC